MGNNVLLRAVLLLLCIIMLLNMISSTRKSVKFYHSRTFHFELYRKNIVIPGVHSVAEPEQENPSSVDEDNISGTNMDADSVVISLQSEGENTIDDAEASDSNIALLDGENDIEVDVTLDISLDDINDNSNSPRPVYSNIEMEQVNISESSELQLEAYSQIPSNTGSPTSVDFSGENETRSDLSNSIPNVSMQGELGGIQEDLNDKRSENPKDRFSSVSYSNIEGFPLLTSNDASNLTEGLQKITTIQNQVSNDANGINPSLNASSTETKPCSAKTLRYRSKCSRYSHCAWRSKSKTYGRYCVSSDIMVHCGDFSTKATCFKNINCIWNADAHQCNKETLHSKNDQQQVEHGLISAHAEGSDQMLSKVNVDDPILSCSSRSLRYKSRCTQLDYCVWRSKTKKTGKFCASNIKTVDCSTFSSKTDCYSNTNCLWDKVLGWCSQQNPIVVNQGVGATLKSPGENEISKLEAEPMEPDLKAYESLNSSSNWEAESEPSLNENIKPCSSRSLRFRSKCVKLSHCAWRSSTKKTGRYCANNTTKVDCDDFFGKTECHENVNCFWIQEAGMSGICGNSSRVEKHRASKQVKFTSVLSSSGNLIDLEPIAVPFSRIAVEEKDFCSEPHPECVSRSKLKSLFRNATSFKLGSYSRPTCCETHQPLVFLMHSVQTYFTENNVTDWYLDGAGLLKGMLLFGGAIPPWTSQGSISVLFRSKLDYKQFLTVLDGFNRLIRKDGYVIRRCSGSEHAPKCSFKESLSSSKKSDFFEISYMEEQNVEMSLRIHPKRYSKSKRCLDDTVPIQWILPTKKCVRDFYGVRVPCPKYPFRYLDATQLDWRESYGRIKKQSSVETDVEQTNLPERISKLRAMCKG